MEAAKQVGLHIHDLTVISTDSTGRQTICIVVTSVLHLNHTQVATGFQNLEIGLLCSVGKCNSIDILSIPQTLVFIVVDDIDGVADEPAVVLILVST